MLKIQKTTASPAETIAFAEQLGKQLHAGDVIAYFGGLGVGKTTFTRGLAKGMGLPDVVSSPTFAIVQEYHGDGLSLYHFDMYRIEGALDLESTGFYDYPLDEGVFPYTTLFRSRRISPRSCRRTASASPLSGFPMTADRSQ